MAHDVFISYSQKDKLMADALCATLERQRIRCWMAPRDIVAGGLWENAIVDAISQAAVMVVIISGNANVSEHVINEVRVAVNRGVAILPFRIEEVVLCQRLEYYLGSRHWLDALTPPLERHLDQLATQVQGLLTNAGEAEPKNIAIAARVKLNGKWGFVDGRGSMIISPQFDDALSFSEGLAAVKLDEKWGYIDRWGNQTIPLLFDDALSFCDGLAGIKQGGKWGFIGHGFDLAIPPHFEMVTYFSEGLASVLLNDEIGFIDRQGNIVIAPQFERSSSGFYEGLAWVRREGENWVFIDSQGNIMISTQFYEVNSFSGGLAAFREEFEWSKKDYKWGFIDHQGNIVILPRFNEVGSFFDGLALVKQGDKYGFIDNQGKLAIALQFGWAKSFSEGLAAVAIKKGDKWGFIDTNGNLVTPPKFQYAKGCSQGLAAVKQNDRWGFIDSKGNLIISPWFEGCWRFTKIISSKSIDPDFFY